MSQTLVLHLAMKCDNCGVTEDIELDLFEILLNGRAPLLEHAWCEGPVEDRCADLCGDCCDTPPTSGG